MDAQVSHSITVCQLVSCAWSNFTTWLMINCTFSRITSDRLQQPLGGKAQFGQRFGEMEFGRLGSLWCFKRASRKSWLKSDDINGRLKAYEAITKENRIPNQVFPESFRVLVKLPNLLVLTCVSRAKMIKEWNFVTLMKRMDECHHVDDLEARERAAQEAKAAFEAGENAKAGNRKKLLNKNKQFT